MSPIGFRWFVCAVIAALVAIMLVVVRGNAAWPSRAPAASAGEQHGAATLARPVFAMVRPAGAVRDRIG